jgi:hypothetical protein
MTIATASLGNTYMERGGRRGSPRGGFGRNGGRQNSFGRGRGFGRGWRGFDGRGGFAGRGPDFMPFYLPSLNPNLPPGLFPGGPQGNPQLAMPQGGGSGGGGGQDSGGQAYDDSQGFDGGSNGNLPGSGFSLSDIPPLGWIGIGLGALLILRKR